MQGWTATTRHGVTKKEAQNPGVTRAVLLCFDGSLVKNVKTILVLGFKQTKLVATNYFSGN